MGRKAVVEGGTRDEILKVASDLFMEKGFDGVTIRTIQREVGCEVGLFYYYFKSKEEVFDVVLKNLVGEYRTRLEELVEEEQENPENLLEKIFDFVNESVGGVERNGKAPLHWTVDKAIKVAFLEEVKEGVEKAIDIMIEAGMERPETDKEVLAGIIGYGVGREVMSMTGYEYRTQKEEILDAVGNLLGGSVKELFRRGEEARRRRDISVELL